MTAAQPVSKNFSCNAGLALAAHSRASTPNVWNGDESVLGHPGTKISGGKVLSAATKASNNRAAQALRMAAQALRKSQSALGAYHRRLCARMDRPKAITATAHKLARLIYFMLTRGQGYVEAGQEAYEQKYRERVVQNLTKRARQLGFELTPTASLNP